MTEESQECSEARATLASRQAALAEATAALAAAQATDSFSSIGSGFGEDERVTAARNALVQARAQRTKAGTALEARQGELAQASQAAEDASHSEERLGNVDPGMFQNFDTATEALRGAERAVASAEEAVEVADEAVENAEERLEAVEETVSNEREEAEQARQDRIDAAQELVDSRQESVEDAAESVRDKCGDGW